ncbi:MULTISPECIES: hypothetical protein [Haloferax]|uniref:Uncharacterized protein n=1 Tax=Haloferax marinum TaxID=2666143 RepID=A0A6A8G2U4_9EURY|nr:MULTISPECIES: hypothetical protein [Haloferax]KAB1196496.1 hypothetical protein Hfx1150_02760 [Haloferax sp. CBA1150]MRW95494.1 hypothetical protein [Haloferax marinum]
MRPKEEDLIDDARESELVSACRTAIGDQLRSITYFTKDRYEQIYLRSDLEADADLAGFVDYESWGFDAHTAYSGSELGNYRFTIRVFDNGFLVRVTTPDKGVFLTTDGLTMHDFNEVATALRSLLAN